MRSMILSLIFVCCCYSESEAWTSKTYQLIVVKSVELMPASFRNIMKQHQEEILSGVLRPDSDGESVHQYNVTSKSGFLQDKLISLSQQIPVEIHDHHPFREIAVDFGRVAHYIADLNDPLILSDEDKKESTYREDFAVYAEKSIPKFPWIFDGHVNSLLEKSDFQDYFYSIASDTVQKYARIGEAYYPDGVLVSSDTFDDRSHPFGIASLSYSHSISDTVQLWFYIWRKAHGDISFTPFYKRPKKIIAGANHEQNGTDANIPK